MLRRTFMQLGVLGGAGFAACKKAAPRPVGVVDPATTTSGAGGAGGAPPEPVPTFPDLAAIGPLGEPNADGLRLPEGFTARVVARSGEPVGGSGYIWHGAPDGGAVFGQEDGGWIYVSNAELSQLASGVGALRFDASGTLVDAYRILSGTFRNCAGGATPWGTWLSCEEHPGGQVWECDPTGMSQAIVRPALGVFTHEAVAVDDAGRLYLTEDEPSGCLYRFTPTIAGDLGAGVLEVAMGTDTLTWQPVPDPSAATTPTRQQVDGAAVFAGGEGIWHFEGTVFFATKGDDRVWALEVDTGALRILYDAATAEVPILTGVDNVTVSPRGDVLVAEDGGDMQLIVLPANGGPPAPLVQIEGHESSEITGPAFDPSYQRLYFSSQRGAEGVSGKGVTYELTAPLA